MRVCLVYDCLYPWTVGGAERWMRSLAEALAADGHDVTYLTRLQWSADDAPALPGVRVVAVSGRDELYGPDGNRRIAPPLRFGRGVLGHLLRHGSDYDVVHTVSFPYFSLLAAAAARPLGRYRLYVDWFEVWSKAYWRGYLGGPGGWVGWAVQRACALVPQQAFVFSRLHAQRLLEEGLRSSPIELAGLYAGSTEPRAGADAAAPREPLVLFAGRHIAEKRVTAIPAAVAAAQSRVLGLRALVLGDGPERPALLEEIARTGTAEVVEAPGFVSSEEVDAAFGRAAALLLPSVREGYGLVVIEAAAAGIPAIVARSEDNAAVELVEEDVNGVVAASPAPADLADAIVAALEAGAPLRERTARWFAANVDGLTVRASLRRVLEAYGSNDRRGR